MAAVAAAAASAAVTGTGKKGGAAGRAAGGTAGNTGGLPEPVVEYLMPPQARNPDIQSQVINCQCHTLHLFTSYVALNPYS